MDCLNICRLNINLLYKKGNQTNSLHDVFLTVRLLYQYFAILQMAVR